MRQTLLCYMQRGRALIHGRFLRSLGWSLPTANRSLKHDYKKFELQNHELESHTLYSCICSKQHILYISLKEKLNSTMKQGFCYNVQRIALKCVSYRSTEANNFNTMACDALAHWAVTPLVSMKVIWRDKWVFVFHVEWLQLPQYVISELGSHISVARFIPNSEQGMDFLEARQMFAYKYHLWVEGMMDDKSLF